MGPITNMTTRKDGNKKNQIITINYDQNSWFIFKIMNNQIKITSDTTFTKKIILYFNRKKRLQFSSMRLSNKSTRNEQNGKV